MMKTAIFACLTCFALSAVNIPVYAEVKSLQSPTLTSLVAGKTFDGKIVGYGWGEEDDPTSLSLDFTVVEPTLFDAAEVESLVDGDSIIAGYEIYTVKSAEVVDDKGVIIITPKEEWLTPLTFTVQEDGTCIAENGEGLLRTDCFSFPGKVSADLVYINAEGESLSAAELMKDLSEEKIETYSDIANITFDENGYIVELDFSE